MKRAPVEQDRDQATPLANPLDALAVGRHCELEKDRNKITDKIVRVHSANTNPTMPQSSLYALLPYVFSWCFVCSLLLSSRLELCPRRRKKRLPHLRLPRLSVCRLSARRIDPSGRSPASLALSCGLVDDPVHADGVTLYSSVIGADTHHRQHADGRRGPRRTYEPGSLGMKSVNLLGFAWYSWAGARADRT